jgi:hypothetical protein
MAYKVTWYVENRIIVQHTYGELAAEDLPEIARRTTLLLDEGHAPVHIIADIRELNRFPTSISGIRKSLTYLTHPSLGWAVLVGIHPVASMILNIITQVARFKATQRATPEAAMDFLARQDQTLALKM